MASRRSHLRLLAGVVLAVLAGGALAQERVGVSSAVNPQASGTPPGGSTRQLVIGQDVVFNERITTGDAGQTQLLFLDQSSMTVGPNSDLTIDEFVFDPRSGTGKLAMSATRGVLRYVGGKLSKQDNAVTMRTNSATLAVRGGAFMANIQPTRTEAIFIFGNGLTVTGANNVSQTVQRPGFQIIVSPGASPSAPTPVPPGQLAQILQQLDGRSGGTGGATIVPTDTVVAQSGITQTISGDLTGSIQQAVQNQIGTTTAVTGAGTNPNPGQTNVVQQPTQVCADASCNQIVDVAPPPPPTPPQTVISYAGRLKDTNGQGTARGFVDQSANGNVAYATGTLSYPQGSPQSGVFTADVGGRVGTITFPLVPGSASFQGSSTGLGTLIGSSFLSSDPNNTFFYANITPSNQPADRLFIYGGSAPVSSGFYAPTGSTRVFAFTIQADAALQSSIPFVRSQAGGNLPNVPGSPSPFYVVAPANTAIGSTDPATGAAARGLQASLAVNSQGANQQSAIAVTAGTIGGGGQPAFNGQLRGSSRLSPSGAPVRLGSPVTSTVDPNGNSFYGSDSISGFVLDQGAATASEVPLTGAATTYGFTQPALPTPVPAGVGANRTTQTLTGNFGGLMYTSGQTNPYVVTGTTQVTTDAATNGVQATLTGSAQSPAAGLTNLTMQYGGTGAAQAFVDDRTFAALETPGSSQQVTISGAATPASGQLYLVSSGAAGAPEAILPRDPATGQLRASYCQCQFLQWGYWGGDLASGTTTPRIDRGHINFWAAGVPTPQGDLNSLAGLGATATYTGHAIGSVFNNGASYIAAGGFNGSYNFGTRSATMQVTNFDGRSFTASGTATQAGANYSLSSSSAFGNTAVNGSFYGPNAAETGGSFRFQSATGLPTYVASGIYAGKRP